MLLLHQYHCCFTLYFIVFYCVTVYCVTVKSRFLSFWNNKLHFTNEYIPDTVHLLYQWPWKHGVYSTISWIDVRSLRRILGTRVCGMIASPMMKSDTLPSKWRIALFMQHVAPPDELPTQRIYTVSQKSSHLLTVYNFVKS